jgi:glycosyltransferase involved in cell wall biosynthesis
MDTAPWGGSEELWSKAAIHLARKGIKVSASVHGWDSRPKRVEELISCGVSVFERKPVYPSFNERMMRRLKLRPNSDLTGLAFEKWLTFDSPDLVVFSDGRLVSKPEWGNLCQLAGLRYVNFCQANSVAFWPEDIYGQKIANFLYGARVQFFLSNHNKILCEDQIGIELKNSEIMCNPFDVPYEVERIWPDNREGDFNLACVGRLEPISKGQDILFSILSRPHWHKREFRVSMFGHGNSELSLRRLSEKLGLHGKVVFEGFTSDIQSIWRHHHALVLPSRHEGQPIVTVEAMLCHRVAITTNVGRNPDLIQDGVDGFIAEACSLESFEAALERAWQNRHRLQEMGIAAGEKIRKIVPICPEETFANRLLEIAKQK